ncbi:MAG: 2-polyprenyl-3-methyl-6-methoxy-1,4-benzoquinone monooxygenase [Burkholderiaceae bacterium]
MTARQLNSLDDLICAADRALRTVAANAVASRPSPARAIREAVELSESERAESAALMRVNHVGEVCAQALYDAQALVTRDAALRAMFRHSADEEGDHLAWTRDRIDALGGRPSLLNPVWYAGAFAIGLVAARAGDRISLGFMAETERQVEAHLDRHLDRLPRADQASRAVVAQMKDDEVRHANTATALGGVDLPLPVRAAMRLAAKLMTTAAQRI